MTDAVIQIAKRLFTVSLKTLDAVHLASALLWRERKDKSVVFLTHDERLAAAAQAEGFAVFG